MLAYRLITFQSVVALLPMLVIGANLATLPPAIAAPASGPTRLITYRQDGQTYYALSLRVAGQPESAAVTDRTDVVILFDTSASQQGAYRDTAMAALESLLQNLRPQDRVQLMAVDLEARGMTSEFITLGGTDPKQGADPNQAKLKQAVERLQQQVPLGSTDMPVALQAATERLVQAGAAHRTILYLGDGNSGANLLDSDTLGQIVEHLRTARVSVNSYAIGPRVNAQSLAALANQTGGNLYVAKPMVWEDNEARIDQQQAPRKETHRENTRQGQIVGTLMADWCQRAVIWPESVQLAPELGQTYPSPMQPVRSDRDTIVVGQTSDSLTSPVQVALRADSGGQPVPFTWTATPEASQQDNAYLAEIVRLARRNNGLALTTVGSEGLAETARMLAVQTDRLAMVAERAVAHGDHQAAGRIAQAVLRRDPGNVQARTVQHAIANPPAKNLRLLPGNTAGQDEVSPNRDVTIPAAASPNAAGHAADDPDGPVVLVKPTKPSTTTSPPRSADAWLDENLIDEPGLLDQEGDGVFLDEVEQQRRVFAEMLSKEIENTVLDARSNMAGNPQTAIQSLKLALDNVRRAADLSAAKRAELMDKLLHALKEARYQASLKDELDREREEELASAREVKFLNDRLALRIEREKQLMDRFTALVDERRYAEAEEVAEIVEEIDPEGVTPRVAIVETRLKRNFELLVAARKARWSGFFDTMYQSELSSIPFPDDPPIVYPDAEFWQDLTNRRKKYASVDLKSQGKAEERILAALREPLVAPLEYPETPLSEVLSIIQEDYDIPIVIDNSALDSLGISAETEISVNLRNITLRSALELMLKQVDELTYVIDNEVLQITTDEMAAETLTVKVYPVADLVLPIQNLGIMGGGGGMSGGGGMGGGGMGGGGMGGGGMGGGGMGGGMGGGGGGFFSVPDDLAADQTAAATENVTDGQAPANLMLARPTEAKGASASGTGPANAAEGSSIEASTREKTSPEAEAASPVAAIKIDTAQKPEQFWATYFATHQADLAVVRQTVRKLMVQGKADHAIVLIQAALRNGQPQSWMYETLGIAMELAGRSKSEIERAIMSACDFSTGAEQLLAIAHYLSQVGLDGRAVDVYRQVIKISSLHHEAYAMALRAAQRAEDLPGVRWATVGILQQAWPQEQAAIRQTAVRVAKATLEQLRELAAQGDQQAQQTYHQYEGQLQQALVRDCVVKVSWSGDADIDLIIEEPSGSVCSLRQPRTTGGGVILGDTFSTTQQQQADANREGLQEAYVCTQGFPGTYRVRIRKVWGELVADRVTVDVYTHYRSPQQLHERQHIPVGEDDAVVQFDLAEGRRTEPIEDEQLAVAVQRQVEVSQALLAQQMGLAQQLGSLSDPAVALDRRGDRNFLRDAARFGRRGAVGYQPIIVTLPEGTQMMATGVISADRRYVRISSSPSFTGIGNVTTFTFAGSSESTGGGGGGFGGGGGGGGGGF